MEEEKNNKYTTIQVSRVFLSKLRSFAIDIGESNERLLKRLLKQGGIKIE